MKLTLEQFTPDQIGRQHIPQREDLPTQYHPMANFFMVVPLADIAVIGSIILPDKARIVMNEGHIVEKGPRTTDDFGVGDCVTWDAQSEYRMEVDGVKFILVRETSITMRIPADELTESAKQYLEYHST